ncbi:MAG: mannose-6-phosphate isomerase, class I [Spirochaetaceae bacterium]|jgi:mannose-6-phosphate isomerase|nr:mannose-6-phosphate isomerase, class I [Spirochaetaceae bacterium]
MNDLYKLDNTVKHYAWGSPEWIPRLTGQKNPGGKPWAELWMGIHPDGPSKITADGKTLPLSELAELPFLLKFLAAESPLSIQAHPNLRQAKEGFEKESRAGIALDSPERNYKDPNHKPEIICALSSFTAMAGFRDAAETERLLSMVSGAEGLRKALHGGYRPFLTALFGLGNNEKESLTGAVLQAAANGSPAAPLSLCGELARRYPGDPGILAPLYLNVIELQPYEAIFIPAGVLHAYIHGFALECMANSDNVLRGGLTPKHIDLEELFSIVSFEPFKPEVLKPAALSPGCYGYKIPCGEFALFLIKGTASQGGPPAELEAAGDAIIAVIDGAAECSVIKAECSDDMEECSVVKGDGGKTGQKTALLGRGESAFAGRRKQGERLSFAGNFTLFAAATPE